MLTLWPRSFWILVLVGFALRLPFLPFAGFQQDFIDFTTWIEAALTNGFATLYEDPANNLPNHFINYPPVYLYLLGAVGWVYSALFGMDLNTTIFLVLQKLLTIAFEISIAMMLYRMVLAQYSHGKAMLVSGLVFLNPGVIYLGSYYGQVDAVFVAFLLGAFWAVMTERTSIAGMLMALALLTKIQTIPYLPLVWLFVWLRFGRGDVLRFTAAFLLMGMVLLFPYWSAGQMGNLLQHSLWFNLGLGDRITMGALNSWFLHPLPATGNDYLVEWLYGADGKAEVSWLTGWMTYRTLGTLLFIAGYVAVISQLLVSRTKNDLLVLAAQVALVFFFLPTMVRERYLFPFVVLFPLIAFVSRRSLFVYALVSLTFLINLLVICPLWGAPPVLEHVNSFALASVAALNVFFFVWVMLYTSLWLPESRSGKRFAQRFILVAAGVIVLLLLWRTATPLPNERIVYLSAMTPVMSEQDWPLIPPEITDPPPGYQLGMDRSTAGTPMQIGDTAYRHGIGAHSHSVIEYDIPTGYTAFVAEVGIDAGVRDVFDQSPRDGTARFFVYVNDALEYESPLMLPTMSARTVVVRMNPAESHRLRLVVDDGGDRIDSDHANWALARVVKTYP